MAVFSNVSKAIVCACYIKYRHDKVNAKTAFPINRNFTTLDGIQGNLMSNSHKGVTRFETSSWSDFVTYKLENGDSNGHITPYALAKNYLEISATNLFRTRLGIDHVNMHRPEWSNLVFFMRYQEITLTPEFYKLLNCPRSMGNDDYTPVSLSIESGLSYVGKSSFVIVQTLTVNGQYVGEQHMQICCINSKLRKTTQLPDSFLTNSNIVPFRTRERPNFPHKFESENMIGSVDRVVFMSDTDENNHLNEAGYIRFIMDACHKLLPDCKKSTHVRCIKGLYKRELREGDAVTISLYQNGNTITARMCQNEMSVFEAEIEFEIY